MNLPDELNKITHNFVKNTRSDIKEATIQGYGETADRYSIMFRNGTLVLDVIGEDHFVKGDSVLVRSSGERNPNYIIISKAYKTAGSADVFFV